jgi:Fe-S cluster assembly iron-binding protein IscA
MLDVTVAAGEAINVLTAAEGRRQDSGGLRIGAPDEQGSALAIEVAAQPVQGDEVITSHAGSQVFLEPGAAGYLSDQVLDVHKDVDGQFHFALRRKF